MVSNHFWFLWLSFANLFLHSAVPVIAIATKFDDLITQVYTKEMGFEKSREVASNLLDEELDGPLHGFKASPKAYVRLEGMSCQQLFERIRY